MLIKTINNPRKPSGDFGDECCGVCGGYSGAYVKLIHINNFIIVCKGCLLGWVDKINETILGDAVEKGRLKKLKK